MKRGPYANLHSPAVVWHLLQRKGGRVWLLLIVLPLFVAVHALGAVTFSELGHGAVVFDQRTSLGLGGFFALVVIAKVWHLAGFAGVGSLRQRATRKGRAAAQSQTPNASDSSAGPTCA